MKKKEIYLSFLLLAVLVVSYVSYLMSLKYRNFTFSAGEILNYPPRLVVNSSPTPPLLSPVDRQKIFDNKPLTHSSCADCVTIVATGDVLPARTVNQKTTQLNNFTWPFEKTYHFLQSADVAIINLETPLVPNCPIRTDGMVFCGDQRNLAGLKLAGVDVVNYANNHSGNAGKQGVIETEKLLTEQGMLVTGITQPVYKTVKDIKFAFLGYNDVEKYGFVADVDDARMQKEITEARSNADVVIVQFHWGEEYRYQPTARQRELGKRVIDLGADLVIGNHPHWIEGVEWYKDKFIMYSHGNFIFDQMWSTETRQGVVGSYTFQGKNLVDVAFHPLFIENYGQPRWMEGAEKQKILDILRRESEKIK